MNHHDKNHCNMPSISCKDVMSKLEFQKQTFSKDYRVASLSTLYPNLPGIDMPNLKSIG